MASVLVIDSDKQICRLLSIVIGNLGYQPTICHTLSEGMRTVSSDTFDVVLLDEKLPDGSGLNAIPNIRNTPYSPEIIIITEVGDADGAEMALRNGAWDYIQKGTSIKIVSLSLIRAVQYRTEKFRSTPLIRLRREKIIGSSDQILSCLDQVGQAAAGDANVLIHGETGTGKELFAHAIHKNSSRHEKNFVVVDCTSLPETLVESMLFGHKKGAFTGAAFDHTGLIAQADNGTLFLDEIGDLPMPVQKTFLRVLEERKYRPLGSQNMLSSNFRLVAATNRNLEEMVEKGTFRSDLLFRLRSFMIELPPLRDRRSDIIEIVQFHTNRICEHYGIERKSFAPEFFESLASYAWPGNVRELVNTIERAVSSARFENILFPRHLPMSIRVSIARDSVSQTKEVKPDRRERIRLEHFPTLKENRNQHEKQYLLDLLAFTNGNKKEACAVAGLSRANLYNLLNKHSLN